MSRATLSIGSNLGDRLAHLQGAVDALAGVLVAVSPVYETAPWGPVPQADYLNAVLIVEQAGVDGRGWLARARQIEDAAGRERAERWGPRSLDVDVVSVLSDDGVPVRSDDPELTLPHTRAHERAFVLVPWAAVEPAAVLPGHGVVAELAEASADPEAVRRRDELVLSWPRRVAAQ